MDAQIRFDPLPLAQALMRRASVTPDHAGAMDLIGVELTRLGFTVRRLDVGAVANLYARLGDARPNFCFAGHVDVVPVGDAAAWTSDPFGAEIKDGWLIGRGAADMKAAIAAMIAAVEHHLATASAPRGSISFLLTSDEEGPALDGTRKALAALAADGEKLDHCMIGEPTSVTQVGDTLKNGRRGSLNARLAVTGMQGHVAYPSESKNPVPILLDLLAALRARRLDDGAPGFDPSNLEVTSVDVANPAHNVIPARAEARLNIRFNSAHDGQDLVRWIEAEARRIGEESGAGVETQIAVTGAAFYTPPCAFIEQVRAGAKDITGQAPSLSTTGGTSDARFIKDYCPVAELGLQNATAHKVDERVRVEDVRTLARIYAAILARYFA